jgi:hypothetical protein
MRSLETRLKISEILKKRVLSEEQINKKREILNINRKKRKIETRV